MRLLKLLLAGLLAFAVMAMWSRRDDVIAAYTEPADPIAFQLTGLDLGRPEATLSPSPYRVPPRPDHSLTRLPTFDFAPVNAVAITGGTAVLEGVVTGPDGPIAGAVVELTRNTSQGEAVTNVATDNEGRWRAASVLGGRYRVRSYLPGLLAGPTPAVFLLPDGGNQQIDSTLRPADKEARIEFYGDERQTIGALTVFGFGVGVPVVGLDGWIVVNPAAGRIVKISVGGAGTLVSGAEASTSLTGGVQFVLRCDRVGATQISVTVGDVRQSFNGPLCVPEPPPEPVDEQPLDDANTNVGANTNTNVGANTEASNDG